MNNQAPIKSTFKNITYMFLITLLGQLTLRLSEGEKLTPEIVSVKALYNLSITTTSLTGEQIEEATAVTRAIHREHPRP